MPSINFKTWTTQQIEDEFGLIRLQKCPILTDWLNSSVDLSKDDSLYLEGLRARLEMYADSWNEEELKLKFISLLLDKVNYERATYNGFANRKLTFKHNGKTIAGVVDFMVASGRYEPKKPYFCFHEYKKEKGSDNDPRGQLLIAMLAAQQINDDSQPVYGVYVLGRMWFFVVLHGKNYCVSNDFSATQSTELQQIFSVLKALNQIII
ncbi:MAG: hypothetical protein RI894_2093 [Bacteroidota bacterium]|jgi:hypothetical protein